MPKLRVLSGTDIVKALGEFGFFVFDQHGSHMKLKREISDLKQTLTVPNHKEIDRGTVHAIYIQASRFISEEDLRRHFYSD